MEEHIGEWNVVTVGAGSSEASQNFLVPCMGPYDSFINRAGGRTSLGLSGCGC